MKITKKLLKQNEAIKVAIKLLDESINMAIKPTSSGSKPLLYGLNYDKVLKCIELKIMEKCNNGVEEFMYYSRVEMVQMGTVDTDRVLIKIYGDRTWDFKRFKIKDFDLFNYCLYHIQKTYKRYDGMPLEVSYDDVIQPVIVNNMDMFTASVEDFV